MQPRVDITDNIDNSQHFSTTLSFETPYIYISCYCKIYHHLIFVNFLRNSNKNAGIVAGVAQNVTVTITFSLLRSRRARPVTGSRFKRISRLRDIFLDIAMVARDRGRDIYIYIYIFAGQS